MFPVVGELRATVVAPAGDEILAAFGVRLRYLPISAAAVPETLGHE